MNQSPESWKSLAIIANASSTSESQLLSPNKEGMSVEPYEYSDELFQVVKLQTSGATDVCQNNYIEPEADGGEESKFAQCHHHLHTINACVEYQQTIKDEMKKIAKLENAIYHKTLSHAQRLARIASGLSPDPSIDWLTRDLDALADHVAHAAEVHHKNAVTLNSHSAAIQQALDSHHELMKSLHYHNQTKTSSASFPLSPPGDRSDGIVVTVSGSPRRIPSPRKITTLAGINVKQKHESSPKNLPVLETSRTLSSPSRVCWRDTSDAINETSEENETGGKEDGTHNMSFTHAHCLFEDIRKHRLVLTNRFEYLRSQQMSIERQLQEEDRTIMYLQENTPDKHRLWNTHVKLEESMSLKQFLGDNGRQLERQTKEAMNGLESFDLHHRDKLSDILRVFAKHGRGHHQTIKRTLTAIGLVFSNAKYGTPFSEELGRDLTENRNVLEKDSRRAAEDNVLSIETRSIPQTESARNECESASTEGACAVNRIKRKQSIPLHDVKELIEFVEYIDTPTVDQNVETSKSEGSDESVDNFTRGESVQHTALAPLSKLITPRYSDQSVQENSLKESMSRDSRNCSRNKSPTKPNVCSKPSSKGNSVSVQVDLPPASPKPNSHLKTGFEDTTKISPEIYNNEASPDAAAKWHEKTDSGFPVELFSSGPQYLDDDIDDKQSLQVDRIIHTPWQFLTGSFPGSKMSNVTNRKYTRDDEIIRSTGNSYFEKFARERNTSPPSVDQTNNHERALLKKYIFSELHSPQGEHTKRERGKGLKSYMEENRQRTRGRVRNNIINSSDTALTLNNRWDLKQAEDAEDIKAQRYIGKYVTKPRRSHSLEPDRVQVRDEYSFNVSKFKSKNDSYASYQKNANNNELRRIEKQGTSKCRKAESQIQNPSKEVVLPVDPFGKEEWVAESHNVNSFSANSRRERTDNEVRAAMKEKKKDIVNHVRSYSSDPIAQNGSYLSETRKISPNKHKTEGESRESGEIEIKLRRKVQDQGRFSPQAKSTFEIRNQSTSDRSMLKTNTVKSNQSIICVTKGKNPSTPTQKTPKVCDQVSNETSDEAFASSDDSEWETESTSTMTSNSLSSSHFPNRKSSGIGSLSSMKQKNVEENNLATKFRMKSSFQGAGVKPCQKNDNMSKSSKKVRFDDKVRYNPDSDWTEHG